MSISLQLGVQLLPLGLLFFQLLQKLTALLLQVIFPDFEDVDFLSQLVQVGVDKVFEFALLFLDYLSIIFLLFVFFKLVLLLLT